jgi:hypothetical protein
MVATAPATSATRIRARIVPFIGCVPLPAPSNHLPTHLPYVPHPPYRSPPADDRDAISFANSLHATGAP